MAPDRGSTSVSHGSATQPYHDEETPAVSDEILPNPLGPANRQADAVDFQAEAEKILAARAADPTNFTFRGVAVGLVIGVVICFSNIYFGLQTGWISGMTMPAALISFGFFKALSPYLKTKFSPVENVLVQSVAGSVGSMPLGCGFVGVMPALEFLLKPKENGPLNISLGRLCLFAIGICLFGVVIAVPLRRQVLIREKLKFPSGSATALMIGVLHGEKDEATLITQNPQNASIASSAVQPNEDSDQRRQSFEIRHASEAEVLDRINPNPARGGELDWRSKIRLMLIAFGISSVYTLSTHFIPQLERIPIFGLTLSQDWLWNLNPSLAYVGQGIIMGPATTIHMLVGAVVGWGILSPIAKHQGWAPKHVDDWEGGSRGWIVWVSLSIMLADAVVSLSWLVLQPAARYSMIYVPRLWRIIAHNGDWKQLGRGNKTAYTPISPSDTSTPRESLDIEPPDQPAQQPSNDQELDAPPNHLINNRIFVTGLLTSFALYFLSMHLTFPKIMSFPASSLSLIFSLFLSLMGVRALGSTDLNPVSGISKLTQLVFSLLPFAQPEHNKNAIALNLLAGAVSESAALQAGDLMQDLKTGHLLGASPKAQFHGQLIGSVVGAVVAACVYRLYTRVYEIPGGQFQTPTAFVWINTARLVTGQGLPPKAAEAAAIAILVYTVLTVVRLVGQERAKKWVAFIPGGIAVAVGMYNEPSFTLARTVGGLISWYWVGWRGREESGVVVLASGLILGEGLTSIVKLVLKSLNVPHL